MIWNFIKNRKDHFALEVILGKFSCSYFYSGFFFFMQCLLVGYLKYYLKKTSKICKTRCWLFLILTNNSVLFQISPQMFFGLISALIMISLWFNFKINNSVRSIGQLDFFMWEWRTFYPDAYFLAIHAFIAPWHKHPSCFPTILCPSQYLSLW